MVGAIALPIMFSSVLFAKYGLDSPTNLVRNKMFNEARTVLNRIAIINREEQFNQNI